MRRTPGPDPVLDRWRATVHDVARQSGQDGVPTVRWSRGSAATYQRRGDVLTVGREFAQRWAAESPQARYIIAHESGHRTGRSTTTDLLRAAFSWRSALTLVLGSATMSALLELDDIIGDLAATLYAVAAGIATLYLLRGLAIRRAQPALFAAEFAADDYATATVGRDGGDVLATMTVSTGWHRDFATHPSEVDRLRRQGAGPETGQRP